MVKITQGDSFKQLLAFENESFDLIIIDPLFTIKDDEYYKLLIECNLLLKQGDLSQNLELRNGDKIYVPPNAAKVYAFGEVRKPGFYPYRDSMTLNDLIQMAGGLTEFANQKKVKIRRVGIPKEIKVNLKDFYKNGALENNVPLDEGDIVVVNSSFFF